MSNLIKCPLCCSMTATEILNLNCGNLNRSTLYQRIKINVCENCGHIYNKLSTEEVEGLKKYYNEEYAPTNLKAIDNSGDRPGSNNINTLKRYEQLFDLIYPYTNSSSKIMDIGCAMGGFLKFLSEKGYNNLSGIDSTKNYVNFAQKNSDYEIKLGAAESIPFCDNSFNSIVLDQVLEHIVDPRKVFNEAKRVLKNDGIFCIGVPDAKRYEDIYFFDFYWFLLREHIQHFDIDHLTFLAEKEGFELLKYNKTENCVMSNKMIVPNLNAIFRLVGKKIKPKMSYNFFELREKLKKYIYNDRRKTEIKSEFLGELVSSQIPVYIWGIGREFLYLYEETNLKSCNIVGLIDNNTHKQKMYTFYDHEISDMDILKTAPKNSVVIICAIAHADTIKESVEKLGYLGRIVEF